LQDRPARRENTRQSSNDPEVSLIADGPTIACHQLSGD
jgi:hypothetical protein